MLLCKRCPYTNVVNFYDDAEPHMSIGSITRCGTATSLGGYTWRFYADERPLSGHTADASAAERSLLGILNLAHTQHSAAVLPSRQLLP